MFEEEQVFNVHLRKLKSIANSFCERADNSG